MLDYQEKEIVMGSQNQTKTNRREFLATSALVGAALAPVMAQNNSLNVPSSPKGLKKLKITKIEAILLSKPLKERFWMALAPIGGYEPKATRVIVKVHTDQGVVGIGEGRDRGVSILKKGFGDLLVGEDPFEVEHIWQKMFNVTISRQGAINGWGRDSVIGAMAPLDAALWDIMSKTVGLPLYKFLGGRNDPIDCYVTGCYYREGTNEKDLVEEVERYIQMGYKALKIKVGGVTIDEDVERARIIRKTVGKDFRLMMDVNKGWSLLQAIEAANKLSQFDFTWLEEPLHWYDAVDGLVRLKKDCPIPLASGEGEIDRYGARRLLETGTLDFMQFDCHKYAGPTEWLKVAGMAAAFDVLMAPHHEPQLHGHLMSSIPNAYILETFGNPDRDPWWFELYTQKPEIVNSKLTLLDEPGIGVEFDKATLKKWGTKIV
jgi:L-alanine-DL-glutamate epimerase-like enolase superfamily enzyme